MAGGQQITVGQGTLTVGEGITLALVGIAVTVSAGLLIGGSNGQVVSVSQGSLVQAAQVALVGSEITAGQGAIVPSAGQQTLTGQAITSGQGTISAGGTPVTVTLSGVEAEAFAGTIDVGPQALSGAVSTASSGTATPSLDVPVTGIALTVSAGTITPGIEASEDTYITSSAGSVVWSLDVALVGSESTVGQGDISTQDQGEILVGSEATAAAGTAEASQQIELTGQEIAASYGAFGAPGGAALTGSEIVAAAGTMFLDNDRTYPLVGQEVVVGQGLAVTSYLAFAAGQELTLSQEQIGPINVALTGEQITSEVGELVAPSTRRPGKSKRSTERKQRLLVTIDGEDFPVESAEEAEELLKAARETYQEQVRQVATQRIAAPRSYKVKPVKMPRIRASGPQGPELDALVKEVASLREEIKALYKQAEPEKPIVNDDDEALAVLL